MLADQAVQQSGRSALREMRGEMVRDTFPRGAGIGMAIWEIRPGDTRGRPVLVASDEQDVDDRTFVTDGTPRDWTHRPPVELYTRVPKKKQREPANVLPFVSGTFVLDAKARATIGGLLSRFGQLLELHRSGDGETLYMFNCTNVIDCIDEARSRPSALGALADLPRMLNP